MIIVRLMGGLGNQMFQYAAGRSLAMKHGVKLKIDNNFFELCGHIDGVTPRNFELNIFDAPFEMASSKEIDRYSRKKVEHFENHLFNMSWPRYFAGPVHYVESGFAYNVKFNNLPSKTYIDGYWQSEKYFRMIGDTLRKEFQFKGPLDQVNKSITNQICETPAVSIHVRRSDYVFNKEANQFHGTCPLSYYSEALNLIYSKIPNPHFFVFSDDIEWAKANLRFGENPVRFINHNYGNNSYRDMQLMSLCRHNIIANSSFSWWAAWLNKNDDKIVIAPRKWFNDKSINSGDRIPESWLKL